MIYFANPCSADARAMMTAGSLGCIVTPIQGNTIDPGWDLVADNGCFSDRWTESRWTSWLERLPPVRFVVCPDVFDPSGAPCHDATVERWHRFAPLIREHAQVPAFVCQVGAAPDNLPADAEVLFLGGTDEWKLGPPAWSIVGTHRSDRWVHMGRVNSRRRLTTARAMGCHSVDGTFLTFGADKNLPQLAAWLADAHRAPMLHE